MHNRKCSYLYGVMLGLTLFIAFAFQGSRGLYETTEGRYAEVAREMLETGNYLEPTLGYQPHWTKPPLTYWAVAGGIKLLGRNAWGARFFIAVAFFFTVVLVAAIGKTLWDKNTGIVSGFVYATSFFTVFGQYSVSTDMLLTLWETGAVLSYLKAGIAPDRKHAQRWVIGMWLFFGFGFLTKGPPSLLPLLVIGVWHYTRRKNFPIFSGWGIVVFIIVGCGWYVWASFRHPGLLYYFLGRELMARVATDVFQRNAQWYKPFIIYIPLLTFGAGFWSWNLLKMVKDRRLFSIRMIWRYIRTGGSGGFLLLWVSIPLIIFFMVKSRLPFYVLPIYTPVALAIGRDVYNKNNGPIQLRKIAVAAFVTGMAIVGLKGAAALYQTKYDMKHLYSLCSELDDDTGNTRFINFSGEPLYGLQFYLTRPVTRLSVNEKPWRDDTFENHVKKIKSAKSSPRHIFITHARYTKELSNALAVALGNTGFTVKGYHDKFWTLFLVTSIAPH